MKTIIGERQRGLLFRNGKFVKPLAPGKYHTFGDSEIQLLPLDAPVATDNCPLDVLLRSSEMSAQTVRMSVGDRQLALHFVNGAFRELLVPGEYAFWRADAEHSFQIADTAQPEVSSDVPEYIFPHIPPALYSKIEVGQSQRCRLYYNRRFVRLLEPGTYYFWNTDIRVDAEPVDIRLTRMDIVGQEILTQDKVSVRINVVCNYRISDYVRVATEVDDYTEQIHSAAQMALREYVGKYKLDEILENKEQMSEYLFGRLKEKESFLYVCFADAGVKDIILPGEVREIMNTVLLAEKRAQANVITRREEVASTRSLLNTARLMEENHTLYQLKELEYSERICENIGNITLNGSGDLLTQLTSLLKRNADSGQTQ